MDGPEVAVSSAVVATATASGVRTEDEAAEKYDCDDEDDARDDADPRGHRVEPRPARLTVDVSGLRRRSGGCHGPRRGFGC